VSFSGFQVAAGCLSLESGLGERFVRLPAARRDVRHAKKVWSCFSILGRLFPCFHQALCILHIAGKYLLPAVHANLRVIRRPFPQLHLDDTSLLISGAFPRLRIFLPSPALAGRVRLTVLPEPICPTPSYHGNHGG
jgi:hypothetical protein